MTDRERALSALEWIWDDEPHGRKDVFADVVLEFAANAVETCATDPTFRAEELRAQIGGQRR